MTIEFGPPSLNMREPVKSHSDLPNVIRALSRRKITVSGLWQLSIPTTKWEITSSFGKIDSCNAHLDSCIEILRDLDGQILIGVKCIDDSLILEFDLHGKLFAKKTEGESICDIYYDGECIESIS
jgi:hypothetical protein